MPATSLAAAQAHSIGPTELSSSVAPALRRIPTTSSCLCLTASTMGVLSYRSRTSTSAPTSMRCLTIST